MPAMVTLAPWKLLKLSVGAILVLSHGDRVQSYGPGTLAIEAWYHSKPILFRHFGSRQQVPESGPIDPKKSP